MSDRIRITDAVPCGSIGRSRVVDEMTVEITVQSTCEFGPEGTLETWVCGQIEGHRHPVRVVVTNEHGNMERLRPVARQPGADWTHVETFGRSDDSYLFVVPAADGHPVDFATWWPYDESHHAALLDDLSNEPSCELLTIGRSAHGRAIAAAVISEVRGPTLAVVSGFHGGEPPALWATDSLLRFAVSAKGADLRRRFRIAAVPLLNIDAVAEGLDRRSGAGVNLWLDKPARNADEVLALDAFLADVRPAAILDIHSWHLTGDGCYTPGRPSTGERLHARVRALRDAIDRRFPLRDSVFCSDDMDCWLTRASVDLGVPAIDPEITMSRGSDGSWKTQQRAQDDGVSILHGAADYLATLQ
jgi:hypothetical protein